MSSMLRIATRKSPLALWQAKEVQRLLSTHGWRSELVTMTTRGDVLLDTPLAKIGGKGLFIKELQRGMLEGTADLAVHSMKDLPAEFPPGLHLAAILPRGNPFDALVSNHFDSLDSLPSGARVGTCSLRRKCQLLAKYPHLNIINLRGNINTRLGKLDNHDYDAIVLAAAGLMRLEMHHRIKTILDPELMLPACSQGAIGIECRSDDARVNALLQPLRDAETTTRVTCERKLNATLGGSCQTPIGGYSQIAGDRISLSALVGKPDGSYIWQATGEDSVDNATALGIRVAEQLIARGADKAIAELAETAV